MTLDRHNLNISVKANRVLNIILVALFLIALRVWHLEVIQYDDKLEESRRPQRRTIIEPAKRATIRDRNGIPLAINKIQYNAAISYTQLRQIPPVVWERDPLGKKVKRFKRREYIARLSELLGEELGLDSGRVEDLIHGKASLYSSIPFTIKEDLSETEYYRLRMLEKDWIGLQVQRLPKRYYPKGKVAGDIIGYMGAINRQEYESILNEIRTLEFFLKECEEDCVPMELPKGIHSEMQARKRLKDLQEHAYTINDSVGKAGIEGRFEQDLRGYHGKKSFYSDARGNFLRELPGSRDPLAGQRLFLTISAELQEYAEKLLAQNERIREGKASALDSAKQVLQNLRQPWIKGGGILVIDPKRGEILTMASYPRFDPNDFIPSGNGEISKQKKENIMRWFENDQYIGEIWDQKRPLEREWFDDEKETFIQDQLKMNLETYLHFILPKSSPVIEGVNKIGNITHAVELQRDFNALLGLSQQENAYTLLNILYKDEGHIPHPNRISTEERRKIEEQLKIHSKEVSQLKRRLDRYFNAIPQTYEKVLLIDLCRLWVNEGDFSSEILHHFGNQALSQYRDASSAKVFVGEVVKNMARELFKDHDFKVWRLEHEKSFLKEKRLVEKSLKQQPKPYTDYLDNKENELFQTFWNQHGLELILSFITGVNFENPALKPYQIHFQKWYRELSAGAHSEVPWREGYLNLQRILTSKSTPIALSYLQTMRGYHDLIRPLLGKYRNARRDGQKQLEKHLAQAFYPQQGFGYGRSQTYRQAASQGSIFKLITSYAALEQRYRDLEGQSVTPKKLNPLEMVDHTHRKGKETFIGYAFDGKPIPRFYKGGRLPRSTHAIGKTDLIKALEHSSNPYFSILAGDILKSPEQLADAARSFGYGERTGIDLPGEISGKIPEDLSTNRTGLYSMAIGQHTLVVTPLQTGMMLAALANGGKILKPKIVSIQEGKKPLRNEDEDPLKEDIFPFQEDLMRVGINFPLFTPTQNQQQQQNMQHPPHVKREIFLPNIIRTILLEGMRRVVVKTQEENIASLSRFYRDYPEAISDYIDLKDDLVGKTSTAEAVEKLDLDLKTGTNLYTHVWFGGIAFNREKKGKFAEPELVVVVYLRYGSYGKEAAPLAAQIVRKWRELTYAK